MTGKVPLPGGPRLRTLSPYSLPPVLALKMPLPVAKNTFVPSPSRPPPDIQIPGSHVLGEVLKTYTCSSVVGSLVIPSSGTRSLQPASLPLLTVLPPGGIRLVFHRVGVLPSSASKA